MKKLVIAILLGIVYNISIACTTTTVASGGKIVTCTICPTSTVCN